MADITTENWEKENIAQISKYFDTPRPITTDNIIDSEQIATSLFEQLAIFVSDNEVYYLIKSSNAYGSPFSLKEDLEKVATIKTVHGEACLTNDFDPPTKPNTLPDFFAQDFSIEESEWSGDNGDFMRYHIWHLGSADKVLK